MRSKHTFFSLFSLILIIAASFVTAANQSESIDQQTQNENMYQNTKLSETKKQELEQHRKQLTYGAKHGCENLSKETPQFLRAVHCPELTQPELTEKVK